MNKISKLIFVALLMLLLQTSVGGLSLHGAQEDECKYTDEQGQVEIMPSYMKTMMAKKHMWRLHKEEPDPAGMFDRVVKVECHGNTEWLVLHPCIIGGPEGEEYVVSSWKFKMFVKLGLLKKSNEPNCLNLRCSKEKTCYNVDSVCLVKERKNSKGEVLSDVEVSMRYLNSNKMEASKDRYHSIDIKCGRRHIFMY